MFFEKKSISNSEPINKILILLFFIILTNLAFELFSSTLGIIRLLLHTYNPDENTFMSAAMILRRI